MGCANYTITFNCVEAETINVVYIVLNANEYSNQTVSIRQRWSDGTTDSDDFNRAVLLESNTVGIRGVSVFDTVLGQESSGAIPADGATVTLDLLEDDSFEFDTAKHSFKYLVSNTQYDEDDLDTLIPLLNTTATITNPSDGLYRSNFTYSNPSNYDYLYIVWDLRYSNQQTLYYDATSESTACCSGTSGTYYLDGTTFGSSTMIYTDADLITKASNGFYSNSQSGGSYRELNTSLNGIIVCPSCSNNSYEFRGDLVKYDLSSDACDNSGSTTSSLYKSDSYPFLQKGDILYTDSALTTTYNGNNQWISLQKPGFTSWDSVNVNASGEILFIYKCR